MPPYRIVDDYRKLHSNGKTKSPCMKSGRRGFTVGAHTRPKGFVKKKSPIRLRDIENASGCSERPLKQCAANCGYIAIVVVLRKNPWLLRQLHPDIQKYVKDSFNCSEFTETVCMRVPQFVTTLYEKMLDDEDLKDLHGMEVYVYEFILALLASSRVRFLTSEVDYTHVIRSATTIPKSRITLMMISDIPRQSFFDTMRDLDSLLYRGMPIAFAVMMVPNHAIPLTVCRSKFVLCNWNTCDRIKALTKLQRRYGSRDEPIHDIILCVHNPEAPRRHWDLDGQIAY